MSKAIQTTEVKAPVAISAEVLIQQAIQNNVPVETMERLMAMRKELKAEYAKEEFDKAMALFQAECPTIQKTKVVKTDAGNTAYKFAPIESIVDQVKAIIQKHGFSYKTDNEIVENGVVKIKAIVTVTHRAGHSEQTSMTVPLGAKTRVMSETQVYAAAQTFAKRYAFCNAFGILTGDEDTDAPPKKESKPGEEELDEKYVKQMQVAKTVEALTKMCSGFKKIVKQEQQKSLLNHFYDRKKELEEQAAEEMNDEVAKGLEANK